MSAARYLFVSDQGRVFSSNDDPTPEDFEYAAVGMVTILRLADGHYYDGQQRKWRPIPRGSLGSGEVEGEAPLPFHAPASDFEPPTDHDPNLLSSQAGDSKPTDARVTHFRSPLRISRGARGSVCVRTLGPEGCERFIR